MKRNTIVSIIGTQSRKPHQATNQREISVPGKVKSSVQRIGQDVPGTVDHIRYTLLCRYDVLCQSSNIQIPQGKHDLDTVGRSDHSQI